MSTPKILIVEDDAILATHLEMVLSQMGYEVTGLMATGEDTVAAALAQKPDAILMDVRLRGAMTGIDAAATIHKHQDTPIVYLTAYVDETLLQQAKITDAYAYLSKPVRDRELRASMEMALYKHKIEKRIQHLNQVLRSIRDVNKLIARERDPQRLLKEACKILIHTRGYQFVWIGPADDGLSKPLAYAGSGKNFLDLLQSSTSPEQMDDIPYVTAMCRKKVVLSLDMLHDEHYAPWREEIEKAHLLSSAAIPMLHAGRLLGVLCVFADVMDVFDEEETNLLLEVAGDLAVGLNTLEMEAARLRAEEALQISERTLQIFVEHAPAAIAMFDRDMRYLAVSQRYLIDYRLKDPSLIGRSYYDIFPEMPERWKAIHQNCLAGAIEKCEDDPFPREDGSLDWVRWEIHPWYDKPGEIGGILLFSEVITAQKEAEIALSESENRFRVLVEQAADALFVHDFNGNFVEVNQRACEMLGYSQQELLSMNVVDVEQDFDLALAQREWAKIEPGTPFTLLGHQRRKNGMTFPVEVHFACLDYHGQRLYMGLAQDITERQRSEDALRESEERYRLIVESANIGIVVHIDNKIIFCNKASLKLIGAEDPQVLIGRNILEFVPEAEREMVLQLVQKAFLPPDQPGAEGLPEMIEEHLIRLDGTVITVEASAILVNYYGKAGLLVMLNDITSRKQAEADTLRHTSELEVLYENSLALSHLLEPEQIGREVINILFMKLNWHHAAVRLYNRENDTVQLLAFSHPGLSDGEVERQIERLNQITTRSKTGLSGWVIQQGQAVRSGDVQHDPRYVETYPGIHSGMYIPIRADELTIGSITVESEIENAFSEQDQRLLTTLASQAAISIKNAQLYLIAQQEIAERKRAEIDLQELNRTLEERVRERNADLTDLYNNAPCGYHSLDGNGIFMRINDTELKWLGYTREEIIGKFRFADLMAPESVPFANNLFPTFKERGWINNQELQMVRKNGSILPVLLNATAVYDLQGHYLMSRSTLTDNTERKRVEAIKQSMADSLVRWSGELEASNKELEAFAYSVSHDLRAPLRAIDGFSRIILDDYSGVLDEEGMRLFNVIRGNAQKMDHLIIDLLSLSKVSRAGLKNERIDMTDLASFTFKELVPPEIQAKFTFTLAPLPDAYGDTTLMRQVWTNLLSNAVKYTLPQPERSIEVGSFQDKGATVYYVKDSGVGFDEKYANKLFGVFQRLHSPDEFEGTGVGLAIVQRIIQRHGGSIWAKSKINQGATFYFSLSEKGSVSGGQ